MIAVFFFSSRRRHTRFKCDWSSDVCSSDLSDLTLLKKKIKDTILGGTIRDIKFSMGFNPALNLSKDKANNLVTSFSEKFKATLEADLVIPKTSIKIPIDLSPNVDIKGKPGFEFKITLYKF